MPFGSIKSHALTHITGAVRVAGAPAAGTVVAAGTVTNPCPFLSWFPATVTHSFTACNIDLRYVSTLRNNSRNIS